MTVGELVTGRPESELTIPVEFYDGWLMRIEPSHPEYPVAWFTLGRVQQYR